MKFSSYLVDRALCIFITFISYILIVFLLYIFNCNLYLVILISFIFIFTFMVVLLYDFFRRARYYNELNSIVENLDKKYLVNEIVKRPGFLEGKILYDNYYLINKCMMDNINEYKNNICEFREYLELWCHEIKTPIATSKLIIENNRSSITDSILEEVEKIDYYIEQVLYYSKMDRANEDYIISLVDLNDIICNIIKNNKKDILNRKIKIEIENMANVYTDSKWISFIINQVLGNSIKYCLNDSPTINICMEKYKNKNVLHIRDNGIGIIDTDLDRVFDKGFTGNNGRIKYNSTGIGLYLCKNLCIKLGCDISIKSNVNEWTDVSISFPNNSYTEDVM